MASKFQHDRIQWDLPFSELEIRFTPGKRATMDCTPPCFFTLHWPTFGCARLVEEEEEEEEKKGVFLRPSFAQQFIIHFIISGGQRQMGRANEMDAEPPLMVFFVLGVRGTAFRLMDVNIYPRNRTVGLSFIGLSGVGWGFTSPESMIVRWGLKYDSFA